MYKNEIINETNDIETEKYKTMDSVYKTQSYFFEVVYEVDKTFGKSDQEKMQIYIRKKGKDRFRGNWKKNDNVFDLKITHSKRNTFAGIYKLLVLLHEVIENLNRTVLIEETDKVIKVSTSKRYKALTILNLQMLKNSLLPTVNK